MKKIADNIRKLEYTRWISENVKHPKNNCFFYSAAMASIFPSLMLMMGPPDAPFLKQKGHTAHFWVEDNDGEVFDPTIKYDNKKSYEKGHPVDVDKNIEYILNDELFNELSFKDQAKVINRTIVK
jgi:hypothetical protein